MKTRLRPFLSWAVTEGESRNRNYRVGPKQDTPLPDARVLSCRSRFVTARVYSTSPKMGSRFRFVCLKALRCRVPVSLQCSFNLLAVTDRLVNRRPIELRVAGSTPAEEAGYVGKVNIAYARHSPRMVR